MKTVSLEEKLYQNNQLENIRVFLDIVRKLELYSNVLASFGNAVILEPFSKLSAVKIKPHLPAVSPGWTCLVDLGNTVRLERHAWFLYAD